MTDLDRDRQAEAAEVGRLRERVRRLERENARAFTQAQHEADALFAQYQLSQLGATGGSPAELGAAVLEELVRLADAPAGAMFLGDAAGPGLSLIASTGESASRLPARLAGLDEAHGLVDATPGMELIVLGEEPPAVIVTLSHPPETELDQDGLRIVQLARHELAVAFAGALLRETLELERQELSSVVGGATDAILQVDEDGRVVRMNPAAERMLGVAAADGIGRTCGDVLGCAMAGGHSEDQCPLARVIATGSPIAWHETAVRGPQGEPVQVAGGYSRSPMTASGPTRATAILRDISAAKALEQLREGFVATVSHELRTPIALVRGYAESILYLSLDPVLEREYVERIHQVTSRLAALVEQILDVTHLDADPLILERAPVAFASLAARCRGDLAVSGDDVRLVVELPPDLPPIEVDSARISRVLENLIGNALKYAPAGSPIRLAASAEDDWLTVTVDDEGPGVPREERDLVLEPFHRAGNVRESRIPGTGLGLYICRRLVEAHGGRLWLADRPDGATGTRVAFQLPTLSGPAHRERLTRAGSSEPLHA